MVQGKLFPGQVRWEHRFVLPPQRDCTLSLTLSSRSTSRHPPKCGRMYTRMPSSGITTCRSHPSIRSEGFEAISFPASLWNGGFQEAPEESGGLLGGFGVGSRWQGPQLLTSAGATSGTARRARRSEVIVLPVRWRASTGICDRKQVGRHRQRHFLPSGAGSGARTSNRAAVSQPLGHSFGREDAVKEHCERFPACMASLQANNNVVVRWGVPGTAQGLVPYDPLFHKSYRS